MRFPLGSTATHRIGTPIAVVIRPEDSVFSLSYCRTSASSEPEYQVPVYAQVGQVRS